MQTWPFSDPADAAVTTLRRVLERKAAILAVYRTADGDWQFLDNDEAPDPQEEAVASLAEIVALDPSVGELADLPPGWCAWRLAVNAPWDRAETPAADPPPEEENPRIVRYEHRTKPFEVAYGDADAMDAICAHFTEHVGEASMVFHEIVSDLVHIDVHQIPPSDERPFWTLYTTGMSDRPMSAPEGAEDCRYAELMIKLPAAWPIDRLNEWPQGGADAETERMYWPVRWLKILARFPHEFDTWLWFGHTVPNGDPPMPFADNTGLCGVLLLPPFEDGPFGVIEVEPGKTVQVLNVIPLHRAEMDLKVEQGLEALIDVLAEAGVEDVLDAARPSTV